MPNGMRDLSMLNKQATSLRNNFIDKKGLFFLLVIVLEFESRI